MLFCEIYEFFKTDILRNNRNACTRAAIHFFYSEIRNIAVVLNGHSFFYNEIQNLTVVLKRPSPSRQILVPRTSRGRPPLMSRGRPLKILFDRPGDVPIRLPRDILKWRPGDVLILRSRDVPERLIRDIPRTFSGRPLEDLESTQTWMSNFF